MLNISHLFFLNLYSVYTNINVYIKQRFFWSGIVIHFFCFFFPPPFDQFRPIHASKQALKEKDEKDAISVAA